MNIANVLCCKKYLNWAELEKEIEKIPLAVDKGNAFEQFCYFFFCYYQNFYQI